MRQVFFPPADVASPSMVPYMVSQHPLLFPYYNNIINVGSHWFKIGKLAQIALNKKWVQWLLYKFVLYEDKYICKLDYKSVLISALSLQSLIAIFGMHTLHYSTSLIPQIYPFSICTVGAAIFVLNVFGLSRIIFYLNQ